MISFEVRVYRGHFWTEKKICLFGFIHECSCILLFDFLFHWEISIYPSIRYILCFISISGELKPIPAEIGKEMGLMGYSLERLTLYHRANRGKQPLTLIFTPTDNSILQLSLIPICILFGLWQKVGAENTHRHEVCKLRQALEKLGFKPRTRATCAKHCATMPWNMFLISIFSWCYFVYLF